MKKITLISLIAPIIIIFLRTIDVLKKINLVGIEGKYQCSISVDNSCSLSEYMFKGDDATLSYIAMVITFISLFVVTSYIFLLKKLYTSNRRKLFWLLIAIGVAILIASYFIFNYIQIIS